MQLQLPAESCSTVEQPANPISKKEPEVTLHINDFEAPPALEDDPLAGCAVHNVIATGCTEPDCPNNVVNQSEGVLPPAWKALAKRSPTPIFRTRSKTRCIL